MPHSNHVENGRNVCWRRASVKRGATFRKLFTAIVGAHFKSATEIVVNNSFFYSPSHLCRPCPAVHPAFFCRRTDHIG
ncbi:hypothetical protein DWV34_16045 [Anaerostipes sp. AF04-45]|nr:hypothetical protein DWV34_16045 [Anaerostipes sp. AF04-45]